MKPTKQILLLLAIMLCGLQTVFAQAEAESAATDAILEAQTGSQEENIEVGSQVRYRLKHKRGFSELQPLGGVLDSMIIVGKDSIPIRKIDAIQAVKPSMAKWGDGLLVFGLLYVVFMATSIAFELIGPFGIRSSPYYTILGVVTILGIVLIPITLTLGIIFSALGRRTFYLGRKWRLRGKEKMR